MLDNSFGEFHGGGPFEIRKQVVHKIIMTICLKYAIFLFYCEAQGKRRAKG